MLTLLYANCAKTVACRDATCGSWCSAIASSLPAPSRDADRDVSRVRASRRICHGWSRMCHAHGPSKWCKWVPLLDEMLEEGRQETAGQHARPQSRRGSSTNLRIPMKSPWATSVPLRSPFSRDPSGLLGRAEEVIPAITIQTFGLLVKRGTITPIARSNQPSRGVTVPRGHAETKGAALLHGLHRRDAHRITHRPRSGRHCAS